MILNKNNIFTIVLVVFLILNTLIISLKIFKKNLILDFNLKTQELTTENSLLIDEIINNLKSCNFLECLNEEEQKILSYINNTKFVFSFSDAACNTCLEDEFEKLRKLKSEIGINNTLLIITCNNPREMDGIIIAHELNGIDINYVSDKIFNLNRLGGSNGMLYFVFEPNSSLKMLFSPNRNAPNLSHKYFETITNTYFNKN